MIATLSLTGFAVIVIGGLLALAGVSYLLERRAARRKRRQQTADTLTFLDSLAPRSPQTMWLRGRPWGNDEVVR